MSLNLSGKEILLGVSGGIACYKAVEVLRLLKKAGAEVTVVMTPHAREFVAPLTFQTLSGRPVGLTLFDLDEESRIGHIRLAERADLALVAPCTANLLAKLRAGIADDLLSTVLLATTAPIYLALAMNDRMLANPATQENLAVVQGRGVHIVPPEVGFLAEGKEALGRLAEPATIVEQVARHFAQAVTQLALAPGTLAGRKVLVTAGPTHEALDPVRFLTNRSSGKMGFAIAEACRDAGARVTLVRGPVSLPDPPGVETVAVETAEQMRQAVLSRRSGQDALILAAAVTDYRAKAPSTQKIKRGDTPSLTLELEANADIAAEAGKAKTNGQVLVVFAAESENLIANARNKLVAKGADLIVANDITEPGSGFAGDENRVTLIRRPSPPGEGQTREAGRGEAAAAPRLHAPLNNTVERGPRGEDVEALPLMSKRAVAERIAAEVAKLLGR